MPHRFTAAGSLDLARFAQAPGFIDKSVFVHQNGVDRQPRAGAPDIQIKKPTFRAT